ncbi:MAG: flagellar basal-body rod protein FlgC [bacterium]|jgi:flagellar basal-body rod protein FlgC
MSLFDAMGASSSGLSAQRLRMNVISSNIANINTTRTPLGGPYRRRDTIFAALPPERDFLNELKAQEKDDGLRHVKVVGIAEDERPPLMKYDPKHPDANEKGYVQMPNINLSEEMVNLMQARRSFEANIASFNATKSMAIKALDIGK